MTSSTSATNDDSIHCPISSSCHSNGQRDASKPQTVLRQRGRPRKRAKGPPSRVNAANMKAHAMDSGEGNDDDVSGVKMPRLSQQSPRKAPKSPRGKWRGVNYKFCAMHV